MLVCLVVARVDEQIGSTTTTLREALGLLFPLNSDQLQLDEPGPASHYFRRVRTGKRPAAWLCAQLAEWKPSRSPEVISLSGHT